MAGSGADTALVGTHVLADEPATLALGRALADRLVGGEVIALLGELGAGKTTFTKGLAAGLGIERADREVTSPTFALHHRYTGGRLRLDHVDAYRLRGDHDFAALDLLAGHGPDAVLVVEWADRVMRELTGLVWTVALEVPLTGGRLARISRA